MGAEKEIAAPGVVTPAARGLTVGGGCKWRRQVDLRQAASSRGERPTAPTTTSSGGALDLGGRGGEQCRMLNLANGYVNCHYFSNSMLILKWFHVKFN